MELMERHRRGGGGGGGEGGAGGARGACRRAGRLLLHLRPGIDEAGGAAPFPHGEEDDGRGGGWPIAALRMRNVAAGGAGGREEARPAATPIPKKDAADTESEERNEGDIEGEREFCTEEFELKLETNTATGAAELSPIPHALSFDQGFFNIIRAVELLRDKYPEKVICIAIAGPPGAGKTTLAHKIQELLGDALVIPLESFVKVDQVIDGNFDDVSLVEFSLVNDTLARLKAGETAEIPLVTIYSAERRKRSGFVSVSVPQSKIIVLEGSYALHASIRPLFDVTVAITGGVHLDLIKRILRDTLSSNNTQKDVLLSVTNVMFPMYKAFIEPDIQAAKIRIHSSYNPMISMVDPVYSCKANLREVLSPASRVWDYPTFVDSLPPLLRQQAGSTTLSPEPALKVISDMYLHPPKYNRYSEYQADRKNWIRIRRVDGLFYIHFYSEVMDATVNTRPTVNFEISVKTISGLLSLGYQIGAILNRTTETWYDANGMVVTKESIKELEQDYIQIKGKNRRAVIALAEQMGLNDHHIPQSFLHIYFRHLHKQRAKNAKNTA